MKTQTRMIVASVVVIALALTAVSGVTYSWFSDTENTSITVSTATLDLNLTVDESKIANNSKSIGTGVSYNSVANSITVTDLAASAVISIPYDLQYKASISTVACVVATFDVSGLDSSVREHIKVGYNGTSTKISELTTDNKIVLLDWKTFPKATAYTNVAAGPITITTDPLWTAPGTSQSFSFTIKAELYQGNYPTATLSEGSASVPVSKVIAGNSKSDSGAASVPVTVDLSQTGSAAVTEGMTLTVTSKNSSTSGFSISNGTYIDLSLINGSTPVTELGGKATITVTVSGDLTSGGTVVPTVAYLTDSSKEQPTVLSYSVSGSGAEIITTITFQTEHFSEYAIFAGSLPVSTSEQLQYAMNAGIDCKLTDDITLTKTAKANTTDIPASKTLSIDMGGKKLTVKNDRVRIFGSVDFTGNGRITSSQSVTLGIVASADVNNRNHMTIGSGVTVESTSWYSIAVFSKNSKAEDVVACDVTVNGKCTAGLYINGTVQYNGSDCLTLTLDGATISKCSYLAGYSKFVAKNSTFDGGDNDSNMLNIKAGDITIQDCTIKSNKKYSATPIFASVSNGDFSADCLVKVDFKEGYKTVTSFVASGNTYSKAEGSGQINVLCLIQNDSQKSIVNADGSTIVNVNKGDQPYYISGLTLTKDETTYTVTLYFDTAEKARSYFTAYNFDDILSGATAAGGTLYINGTQEGQTHA